MNTNEFGDHSIYKRNARKSLSQTKRFHNISFENLSVIKEGLATWIRGEIMERGKTIRVFIKILVRNKLLFKDPCWGYLKKTNFTWTLS